MVHSAVGVDDGVLHEAAVLVDLLLGDLRFLSMGERQSNSGVAAAAWRVVLKYPAGSVSARTRIRHWCMRRGARTRAAAPR